MKTTSSTEEVTCVSLVTSTGHNQNYVHLHFGSLHRFTEGLRSETRTQITLKFRFTDNTGRETKQKEYKTLYKQTCQINLDAFLVVNFSGLSYRR